MKRSKKERTINGKYSTKYEKYKREREDGTDKDSYLTNS
jgi:hypothetical protein